MADATFKKTLHTGHLLAIGIGGIIGAGVFVLTGTAAAHNAGPGIILSYIIAAFVALLAGFTYAELASAIPSAGGAYAYVRRAFNDTAGWLVGWCLMLAYLVGAATVAVGFSGYLTGILADAQIILPAAWTNPHWQTDATAPTGIANLPAFAIVLLITAILCADVRRATAVASLLVAAKLLVIVLFIVSGIWFVDAANLSPLIPPQDEQGRYGVGGVLSAASMVFFAFVGFETIATAAQESRNPARDLPRSMIGALAVCAAIYALVAFVLVGLVPYAELSVADPLSLAIARLNTPWLKLAIALGALIALASVLLVNLYAFSRISRTMAADGVLPERLARLHPTRGVPIQTTLIAGGGVAIAAALFPVHILGGIVSLACLTAYVLVAASLLRLRRTEASLPRPFRCPLTPWLPLASIFCCFGLIFITDPHALLAFAVALLAGWLLMRLLISNENMISQANTIS